LLPAAATPSSPFAARYATAAFAAALVLGLLPRLGGARDGVLLCLFTPVSSVNVRYILEVVVEVVRLVAFSKRLPSGVLP
jgi:hypothetical protein